MTELDKKDQERIKALAKLAEESEEDMKNIFEAVKFALKSKQPSLPEVRLINQTLSNLEDHYKKKSMKKAVKLPFVPMGVFSEAKDQNKAMRDEINKEWSEPHNHAKMIGEGKVFTMKIGEKTVNGKVIDEKIAISGNHPYKTSVVDGIKVVTEATPWKPGDKIVPRNYPQQIKYGEEFYDNWNYGEELDQSWKITLFGIGYFDGTREVKTKDPETGTIVKKSVQKNLIDDAVITRLDFFGEFADPTSPKYIVKQPIWFNLCQGKGINQKYSNDLLIQARSKAGTGLEILDIEKLKLLDFIDDGGNYRQGVISRINERVDSNARKLNAYVSSEEFEQEPKDKKTQLTELNKLFSRYIDRVYIPIIDLIGVDDWHKTYKALRDPKTGEILKENGWDKTDFNAFALSECSYTGMYEPANKPPKMVITDGSLPQSRSLFCKFPNGIDKKLPEGNCLISIMTSRGDQVYDEESGEYIKDPENAVAIPKIKGIKILFKFAEIDVGKILADL